MDAVLKSNQNFKLPFLHKCDEEKQGKNTYLGIIFLNVSVETNLKEKTVRVFYSAVDLRCAYASNRNLTN